MTSALDVAKAVGDAVLYEGYLLYPYRASAAKNQVRWQFGVLMPPAFDADGDHADARTECLLEPGSHASVHLRLRFLHAQHRLVEDSAGPVPSLVVDGVEHTAWDEAVEREVDAVLPVAELLAQPNEVPFTIPGDESVEPLGDAGRLVRRTLPLTGLLRARADALAGPFGGVRLRVEVVNTAVGETGERADALRRALLATHLVIGIDNGRFLSMVDPPEWARPAAEACVNDRLWPVLVGDPDDPRTVLAAPIILYDFPSIAPESPGALFDGTEIDEILTLRTMALTDEEKRQARATDPRAGDLLDRVDGMPPEILERLHGTIRYLRSVTDPPAAHPPAAHPPVTYPQAADRYGPAAPPRDNLAAGGRMSSLTGNQDQPWWDPGADATVSPETDTVVVAGVTVGAGRKVRLRPGSRRADAQDMFLVGRVATVRAVLTDVDDDTHIAVTIDDDPAAEFQGLHGRFRYFSPDEIEPIP